MKTMVRRRWLCGILAKCSARPSMLAIPLALSPAASNQPSRCPMM
jgi:hypothetical protein